MRRLRLKDRLKYKPIRRPCNSCGSRKRCLDPDIPISEKKRNKTSCLPLHEYLSSLQVGQCLHGENWLPKHDIGLADQEVVKPEKAPDRFLWSSQYGKKDEASLSAIAEWGMVKRSVTPKQYEVLYQQRIKSKSLDEIAIILNLSRKAVWNRIQSSELRIKKYGRFWKDKAERSRQDAAKDAGREKIIIKRQTIKHKDPARFIGKLWKMCQDFEDCKKCISDKGRKMERCPVDDSKLKWQIRNVLRSGADDPVFEMRELQIPCK